MQSLNPLLCQTWGPIVKGVIIEIRTQCIVYGGSGQWKSTFTKDSTTLFKQITGGYFLYQHVEN